MEDKIKQAAEEYAKSVCTNPDYSSTSKEYCQADFIAGANWQSSNQSGLVEIIEHKDGLMSMSDNSGIFARLGKLSNVFPEGSQEQKTIFKAMSDLADGYESTSQLKELRAIPSQSGEGVERIKQVVKEIRNELYDSLPSGETNAFDLIKIINIHMRRLDEVIYNSTS